MTSAFYDSSALVKLVMDEPGALVARAAWREASERHCSRLAFVETRAALAAAHRYGRLDTTALQQARTAMLSVLEDFTVVEVDATLVDLAGDVAETHFLRGFDAVHVAAALTIGAELFVSSDLAQLQAASAESLTTLDPASAAAR